MTSSVHLNLLGRCCGSVEEASGKCQGGVKKPLKMSHGCVIEVFRKFRRSFKELIKECWRSEVKEVSLKNQGSVEEVPLKYRRSFQELSRNC